MSDENKSISQLDELSAVNDDDLMIVSHLSGSSYVSRSVPVTGLSSVCATKADFDGIEEALRFINNGVQTPADVFGIPMPEWKDDGYTYMHIDLKRIPDYVQDRRTFKFKIGCTSVGCLTVDWGDGTTSTNLSGSTTYSLNETIEHTYAVDAGNKFSVKFTTSLNISFYYQINGLFWYPQSNAIYAVELGKLTKLFGYAGGGGLTSGRADISIPSSILIRLLIGTDRMSTGFYGAGLASLEVKDSASFYYSSQNASPTINLGRYIDNLDVKILPPNGQRWVSLVGMFANSTALKTLDISYFDTSLVQNTYLMFDACYALYKLNMGSPDWSSCTTMQYMFRDCQSMHELDVSNWNMSAVTNMLGVFQRCYGLEFLDVSNWNTSQVTNMSQMFEYCNRLSRLDVSNWDVSKVTTFQSMFNQCNALTQIDVSNWTVSACTNVGNMFNSCGVTSLDLTNWDLSYVMTAGGFLYNATSLSTLIGGKTIAADGSINGSTAYFGKGPHNSIGNMQNDTLLDHDSLLFLIYWIPNMMGSATQTIQMGVTLKAKLTTEEIAIATAKNWSIT